MTLLILGPVKITAVQSGGKALLADINISSSRSTMKMQAASGSFNMGDGNFINNAFNINANSQFDPDLVDMPTP